MRVSPQQQRLLQFAGDDAARRLRQLWAISIDGPVTERALESALRRAIDEEMLPGLDDRSLRVESAAAPAPPAWLDELARLLSGDEAIQARLVRHDAARSSLLLGVPSLCADAASGALVVTRLLALMRDETANAPSAPAFASYVDPMIELLESPEIRGWEHWIDPALDAATHVRLPFEIADAASPTAGSFDSVAAGLTGERAARLRACAESLNAPIAALALTCWYLVLRRLTGRDELAILTAFDGRTLEDSAQAIGPFARNIPLICRAPEDGMTFADAVDRSAALLADASLHQEYFSWDKVGIAWPDGRAPG